MKKVDRLLMKVQESQHAGDLQVGVCLVEQQDGDVWQSVINLWSDTGEAERLVVNADTMEDAIAAIDKAQAEHVPAGRRSKQRGPVVLIDNGIMA